MATITTDIYQGRARVTFNEGRHTYHIRVPAHVDKLWQPSVTGVLGMKAKPALTGWAAKKSLECVGHKLGEYEARQGAPPFVIDTKEIHSYLAEAADGWNEDETATTVGTVAHRFAHEELRYRAGITDHRPKLPLAYDPVLMPGFTPGMVGQANEAVLATLDFFNQHNVRPIIMERPLWMPQEGFVGTPDGIGFIDDELCIWDYKTSKRIYAEYWMQLAALQAMYQNEFPEQMILRRWCINIKKDGSGVESESRALDHRYIQDLNAFRACLTLYNWDRANDDYRKGTPVEVLGNLDNFIPRPNSPAAVAQEPAKRPTAPSSPVTSGAKNLTTEEPWPL